MVVEDLASSEDINSENDELRLLYPDLVPGITRRVSFFKKRFKTVRGLNSIPSNSVLGYAIIKEEYLSTDPPWFCNRIWESVLINSPRANNFIRGAKTWEFQVQNKKFHIPGYLYAEQNGDTNCCAHVALRSVAATFHPDGDMTYAEMNQILGIDHISTFAWDGLSLKQQSEVLSAAGAKCISANFAVEPTEINGFKFEKPPFQRFVYGSIESGYPSIITFKTQDAAHAIPVFGHTFNQDTWVPLAEGSYFSTGGETRYIPSDAWLSMFVGHDDNFGSNVCIPNHYLQRFIPGENINQFSPKQVAYVIATIPPNVKVEPLFAELIGAHYLWHISKSVQTNNAWNRRLKASVEDPKNPKNNRIVLRPRLIYGGEYAEHLSKMRGWNGEDKIRADLQSPILSYIGDEWIWVIEFSMLEIFTGNLRKLGEILVRADKDLDFSETDLEGFLLARIPSFFVTIEKQSGEPTFIPSGIDDHVKLLDCG